MIGTRKRLIVLLGSALALLAASIASGSIGGGFNTGGPVSSVVPTDGGRELVAVERVGRLLVGGPTRGSIRWLAIEAPEVDAATLIVRESADDADLSLLWVTAPEGLRDKVLRATLYVSHPAGHSILFERVGDGWIRREAQPVELVAMKPDTEIGGKLFAFSVSGLGQYALADSDVPIENVVAVLASEPGAPSRTQGAIVNGLLPWAASIALLAVAWLLSNGAHRFPAWRVG